MSEAPQSNASQERSWPGRMVAALGDITRDKFKSVGDGIRSIGGMSYLLGDSIAWVFRAVVSRRHRMPRGALAQQMVRVGVESVGIVVLVQMFIGCILALQLAPILDDYGQLDQLASVISIAIFRELGPFITGVVLSGFAGASIAAEISAMVESEEIKALRAHALNPIRFLIVPRFLATVIMIVGLSVIADVVGVLGGFFTAWGVLDMSPQTYIDTTQQALVLKDFLTGLVKAGVFGVLISMIACHSGLTVKGGAVGVGRATTSTVVRSIVAIIGMDALFTASFYAFGL